MNASDQALLAKLMTLLDSLSRGDEQGRLARESTAKLKAAAKRGDKVAQKAWNSLSALYWGRMSGGTPGTSATPTTQRPASATWVKAEAYYAKLLANDPAALAWLRGVQERARSQGPASDLAKKALAILKSIHNHRKGSVWYPGAPVPPTTGYSMPHRHRPGIVIGGYVGGPFDQFLPPGLSPSQIPGLGQVPGMLGQVPGLGQALGQLGQVPGLGGAFPGAGLLSQFLPLTTESAASLLSMIAQARQSPGRGGGGLQTSAQLPHVLGQGLLGLGRPHLSEAEQAANRADEGKMAAAVAMAEARNSPAAPGLRVMLDDLRRRMILAGTRQPTPNTATDEANLAKVLSLGLGVLAASPEANAIRAMSADPGFQRGYAIGSGMAHGEDSMGPGKLAARRLLGVDRAGGSDATQRGFDTAMAVQFGITAGRRPALNADKMLRFI